MDSQVTQIFEQQNIMKNRNSGNKDNARERGKKKKKNPHRDITATMKQEQTGYYIKGTLMRTENLKLLIAKKK